MTVTWKHDELMRDLAGYLRGPEMMVWEDMQLGPSGSPRPDVFTLRKSYSKPMPTAFECKVSRSDLRSDTTSGKWQAYLKYASSVTFAVPDGLCTVADIPDGCGLIVRKAEVWRYARRPTVQRVTPPFEACMKLLIDGVHRTSRPTEPKSRSLRMWEDNEAVRKKFGQAVARAARDLAAVQADITNDREYRAQLINRAEAEAKAHKQYLIDQAKREAAEFERDKLAICEWLGLGTSVSAFVVRRRIQALKAECCADSRVQAVERQLEVARRSIEGAMHAVRPVGDEAAA